VKAATSSVNVFWVIALTASRKRRIAFGVLVKTSTTVHLTSVCHPEFDSPKLEAIVNVGDEGLFL